MANDKTHITRIPNCSHTYVASFLIKKIVNKLNYLLWANAAEPTAFTNLSRQHHMWCWPSSSPRLARFITSWPRDGKTRQILSSNIIYCSPLPEHWYIRPPSLLHTIRQIGHLSPFKYPSHSLLLSPSPFDQSHFIHPLNMSETSQNSHIYSSSQHFWSHPYCLVQSHSLFIHLRHICCFLNIPSRWHSTIYHTLLSLQCIFPKYHRWNKYPIIIPPLRFQSECYAPHHTY